MLNPFWLITESWLLGFFYSYNFSMIMGFVQPQLQCLWKTRFFVNTALKKKSDYKNTYNNDLKRELQKLLYLVIIYIYIYY